MSKWARNRLGQAGEDAIKRWLVEERQCSLLPLCDIDSREGSGGPRYIVPGGTFVSPDFLVSKDRMFMWVEVKCKSHATWHYVSRTWTTGIDLRYYNEYIRVQEQSQIPLWLIFYHESALSHPRDVRRGATQYCPRGIYGGEILALGKTIHHRYEPGGMIYWAIDDLVALSGNAPKHATLAESVFTPAASHPEEKQLSLWD